MRLSGERKETSERDTHKYKGHSLNFLLNSEDLRGNGILLFTHHSLLSIDCHQKDHGISIYWVPADENLKELQIVSIAEGRFLHKCFFKLSCSKIFCGFFSKWSLPGSCSVCFVSSWCLEKATGIDQEIQVGRSVDMFTQLCLVWFYPLKNNDKQRFLKTQTFIVVIINVAS